MLNWLEHLDENTQWKVLLAYVKYQLYWTEPSQDDILVYSIFKAKQFDLDSIIGDMKASRENWKKGWRPKKTFQNLNEPKQTKTQPKQNLSKTEQEQEKEQEHDMEVKEEKEEKSTTTTTIQSLSTEQEARISYMNGMRNVEIRWRQLINRWNKITWREEFMNEDLKKAIYNLQGITLDAFEERVKKYWSLCKRIQNNKAEKLFYYPIRERDLLKFIAKINLFYWDDSIIISKLAHKDWVIKDRAVKVLTTQQTENKSEYSNLLEKLY